MSTLVQTARHDERLSARIVSRRQLTYTSPASPALDRPLFVRAASGICWFSDKLAIIQDDASFIALVEPLGAGVAALPLTARAGLRQFDKSRHNKRDKLDLECCFTTEVDGVDTLFALGSGSNPRREQIVTVRALANGFDLRTIEARSFYAALNQCRAFAGGELNLEGATLRGDKLLLWQRGNGAPRHGLVPVNATCEISFAELVQYLDDPLAVAPPALQQVTQYDLGSIAGVPLTFTDASRGSGDEILFTASAEASPNAVDDGAVVGAAVGILAADGSVRLTPLRDEADQLCRDKIEGIVLDPGHSHQAWLVMDPDDHTQPASLLEVRLAGFQS